MSWIKITDNFQVYSLRDDFMQFFDWGLYFLDVFFLPFMIMCIVTLILVVFLSLGHRLDLFKRVLR